MAIVMTIESSAELLGINPAIYTDPDLKALASISRNAERMMKKYGEDSDEYWDLFVTKSQADQTYDARFSRLNTQSKESL